MGGTRPARDRYTVAIAPHRPGTFLTPFPLPLAFESPPDARYGGDVVLSAWLTPRPHGHALAGATGINPRRVNAPGLASRSLRPRDSVVPRLRTLSVATYTLRMRFSVGAYPSFSPFSQTISCKKGVSPGLALHCARHTAGDSPHRPCNRGRSSGGRSECPLHPFFSSLLRQPNHPSSLLSAIAIQPQPPRHSISRGGRQQGTNLRIWGVPLLVLSFRSLATWGERGGC